MTDQKPEAPRPVEPLSAERLVTATTTRRQILKAGAMMGVGAVATQILAACGPAASSAPSAAPTGTAPASSGPAPSASSAGGPSLDPSKTVRIWIQNYGDPQQQADALATIGTAFKEATGVTDRVRGSRLGDGRAEVGPGDDVGRPARHRRHVLPAFTDRAGTGEVGSRRPDASIDARRLRRLEPHRPGQPRRVDASTARSTASRGASTSGRGPAAATCSRPCRRRSRSSSRWASRSSRSPASRRRRRTSPSRRMRSTRAAWRSTRPSCRRTTSRPT